MSGPSRRRPALLCIVWFFYLRKKQFTLLLRRIETFRPVGASVYNKDLAQ